MTTDTSNECCPFA